MRILVIGEHGQLATHLLKDLSGQIRSCSREALDLSEVDSVYDAVLASSAQVVINSAAYTDTNRAESEPQLANAINGEAVGEIAKACQALDALLIHVSTDYIFDGAKTDAYVEDDQPNPLNVYGASKLLGEQLVQKYCDKYLILRTSWVFSAYGKNFVKTIFEAAKKRETLQVVNDQFGMPTYAGHLSSAICSIINRYQARAIDYGVFHYADAPVASWYDLATEIINAAEKQGVTLACKMIEPVGSDVWKSPIKRPQNSQLNCQKIEDAYSIKTLSWQQGVAEVIKVLNARV